MKETEKQESTPSSQERSLPGSSDRVISYPAKAGPIQRKATHIRSGAGSADLHDHGSAAKLYNLEVEPAKRKRSAGKDLVQKAAQQAVAMGKDKLVLESQDNGSGKLDRWYRGQGFKASGRSGGMNSFELSLQRKVDPGATRSKQPVIQAKSANRTGLPDGLKSKMENAFGTNLNHVRVKTNSSLPGKVGAIATTQGNRMDFAPGHFNPSSAQGQRLIGHETWHTVQQAQGRVKPTLQMKTGHLINDSASLEKEADRMGDKIARASASKSSPPKKLNATSGNGPIQRSVAALPAGGSSKSSGDGSAKGVKRKRGGGDEKPPKRQKRFTRRSLLPQVDPSSTILEFRSEYDGVDTQHLDQKEQIGFAQSATLRRPMFGANSAAHYYDFRQKVMDEYRYAQPVHHKAMNPDFVQDNGFRPNYENDTTDNLPGLIRFNDNPGFSLENRIPVNSWLSEYEIRFRWEVTRNDGVGNTWVSPTMTHTVACVYNAGQPVDVTHNAAGNATWAVDLT